MSDVTPSLNELRERAMFGTSFDATAASCVASKFQAIDALVARAEQAEANERHLRNLHDWREKERDEARARADRLEKALREYAAEQPCPDCDGTRTVFDGGHYENCDCLRCATGFISTDSAWDGGIRARAALARDATPTEEATT